MCVRVLQGYMGDVHARCVHDQAGRATRHIHPDLHSPIDSKGLLQSGHQLKFTTLPKKVP